MSGRTLGVPVFAGVALAALIGASVGSARGASKFNRKVEIGQAAPKFSALTGIDGKPHSLDDYKAAKVVVIAFICNQCPIAQMYEERFIRFARAQKRHGVVFIAINSSSPSDGLEKMKERANQKGFDFPYLNDATQETSKAYGATVTPQLFVLDRERNIAYMGKFDDDFEPEKAQKPYVRDAVHALLEGKRPDPSETRPSGCGIEYGKPQ
jgi:peroxiredoxin